MLTTIASERERLELDDMGIDGLRNIFQNHRLSNAPAAKRIRFAIAQVLEERGVENDVLATFLKES
jgi:hypothetical protein